MASGLLSSPKEWVGVSLRFKDGTSPFVFRETARRETSTDEPTVIVIQFRLAFPRRQPLPACWLSPRMHPAHAVFAGFPGFRSKLWADDIRTGVYAGIYEWQGAGLASHYAERMVGLLAPFSNPGTARYHVIEGRHRDDYLSNAPEVGDSSSWWQLSEAPLKVRLAPRRRPRHASPDKTTPRPHGGRISRQLRP